MKDVLITHDEAESLLDWLEIHLIDDIRNDLDVDSMEWLGNMMNIYRKCKEALTDLGAVGGKNGNTD